jgi:hypothetical protein
VAGILLLGQAPNERNMQLGLQQINYYMGFCQFLNWNYAANSPFVVQVTGGTLFGTASMWDNTNTSGAPYFDATTGDVKMPFNTNIASFGRRFFQGSGEDDAVRVAIAAGGMDYTAVRMVAYCDAGWTLQVQNVGAGGSVISGNGSQLVTFTMGNGSDAVAQYQCTPVGTPTNAPNVRVCKEDYKSRLDAGEVFDPDWLAIVRPFAALRYMDMNQTNGSALTDYSQLATSAYKLWGKATTTASGTPSGAGYLSGMPLSVICDLANLTGTEIHYCIPHQATDSCVQSIAQFFKDNTTRTVTYEFTNEHWNSGFTQQQYCLSQGVAIWGSGDLTRDSKWYGYRSVAIMKLISDIYAGGKGTRWRGGLGTQSVNTNVTNSVITGINYYITNVLGGVGTVSTYFDDLLVTAYMGATFTCTQPTDISNNNPGVVTATAHGKNNGDVIKIFVNSGMTELNDTYATVANRTANTFELQGVDTTGFGTYVNTSRNFFLDAKIFQLMDQSLTNFNGDPVTYPTKYKYFNQQVATSIETGTCSFGFATSTNYSLVGQSHATTGSWKLQKDIATTNGMILRMYEGGPNFNGGVYFGGFSGAASPQYVDYEMNFLWSQELADVMTATYVAFADYGDRSSQFTEGGNMGAVNSFSGLRAVPTDQSNPRWQAVASYNRGY